jgi:DNA polymerase-1
MEILAAKYPVCQEIVTYRNCGKMLGTYLEPLTERAILDPRDRIHPSFWIVSSTGRSRCENPNLQNIPARLPPELNIRRCFIADDGHVLIVADLSQAELRLCGHITKDKVLVESYCEWKCTNCGSSGYHERLYHECPKCGVQENEAVLKNPDEVKGFWHGRDLHQDLFESLDALTSRNDGKTANFELIYGATPSKLNQVHPHNSKRQWARISDGYFERHVGVQKFHDLTAGRLSSGLVCYDIFGRKRRIRKREVAASFKHAFNMAVNFPVQCSAGSYIIMLRLICFGRIWLSLVIGKKTIWPVNFVHDEVVFEVVENRAEELARKLQYRLEYAVQLRVPMRADIAIDKSWGDAK